MNIYLLRHGETDENINRFYYGKLDVSLNENGKLQVYKAKEFLSSITFDRIYSSDRKRAIETANMAAEGSHIIRDSRINEMDFGNFEGKDYKQIQKLFPKEYEMWNNDWKNFAPPGGESYADFYNRIKAFMEDLLKLSDDNILIVTHGGVIRTIYCYVLNGNMDYFWKFSSKNADISVIKYEYNNIFIDSITHMK
jgi:alpha-ribazole phosphatase